jgi:hypothetical protein
MTTKQLTEPCWIVYLADGDEVHLATSKDAHDWVTPDIAHHVSRIGQPAQPCFTATCDTCGEPEGDENDNPMHYGNPGQVGGGWLHRNPDGTHTCDDCRPQQPATTDHA